MPAKQNATYELRNKTSRSESTFQGKGDWVYLITDHIYDLPPLHGGVIKGFFAMFPCVQSDEEEPSLLFHLRRRQQSFLPSSVISSICPSSPSSPYPERRRRPRGPQIGFSFSFPPFLPLPSSSWCSNFVQETILPALIENDNVSLPLLLQWKDSAEGKVLTTGVQTRATALQRHFSPIF